MRRRRDMADGDPVRLGQINTELASPTTIERNNGWGFTVFAPQGAISGVSDSVGIVGIGENLGVDGTTRNGIGVRGASLPTGGEIGPTVGGDGDGVIGLSHTRRGVAGFSDSGVGVVGNSASSGQLVAGIGALGSAAPGIGVLGLSSRGISLFLPR